MRLVPHPITLRQLQYVVAVADQKSFRKAAAACHVSQPALSAQVAQVESALTCKLFDRDTQRVLVSSAGRAFVERARELLMRTDALVEETQREADPLAGPLRLGIIPTVGPYLLPEVAQPLRTQFPRLRFTWVEERTAVLMKLLKQGELDGAIVALETKDLGEVQSLVLGRDQFFLAMPNDHALARETTPVSTQVLKNERVLVLEEGHCLGEQVEEVCQRARTSELDVCATSLATLTQMVVGGAGVTLLPGLALEVENRRGTLHLRPFIARAPGRTLALVWRKSTTAHGALKAIAPSLRKGVVR